MKFLLIASLLAGCASFRGESSWNGPSGVTFYHNHRGGGWYHSTMRQMWVGNGTNKTVFVTVECPDRVWNDFPVPAHRSQGFAEWDGECAGIVVR